jgi:hypothetical protein
MPRSLLRERSKSSPDVDQVVECLVGLGGLHSRLTITADQQSGQGFGIVGRELQLRDHLRQKRVQRFARGPGFVEVIGQLVDARRAGFTSGNA